MVARDKSISYYGSITRILKGDRNGKCKGIHYQT